MLRFGPESGPVAVVALPLFEEANRVRAFAVTICRALAKRGVASVLPDVPGQGESLVPTQDASLPLLRGAVAALVERLYSDGRHCYTASIRSGAILGSEAHALGRWYFSPVSGKQLVDSLARILSAAKRDEDALLVHNSFQIDDGMPSLEIAGNATGTILLQELTVDPTVLQLGSVGILTKILRLDSDPKPADRHVPGTPLWRRAEPGNDLALATLLADDIADWIAACEG